MVMQNSTYEMINSALQLLATLYALLELKCMCKYFIYQIILQYKHRPLLLVRNYRYDMWCQSINHLRCLSLRYKVYMIRGTKFDIMEDHVGYILF